MNVSARTSDLVLLGLLKPPAHSLLMPELASLPSAQLSGIYVSVCYLRAALAFLGEQFWLRSKEPGAFTYAAFLAPFLGSELEPLGFLHELLASSNEQGGKGLKLRAQAIESAVIETMIARDFTEQKSFARLSLESMALLFVHETALQKLNFERGTFLGISLYRAYDSLDSLFGLNYSLDIGMRHDPANRERLYEGAGVGVQSGCSTILTALHWLKLESGARLIDLGSGYGRVGMLVGLLRPDIDFTGYEYVKERVANSSLAAKNFGLDSHVHFLMQDLSSTDFLIPEAEAYYLYDPFSESTYRHVLAQLSGIGRRKKISIITKGNASHWLGPLAEKEGWAPALEYDAGNLRIYESRPGGK